MKLKAMVKNSLLLLTFIVFGAAGIEFAAQYYVAVNNLKSARYPYEMMLANTINQPERLFPAGFKATHNIRGLYAGAEEATLRAGPNRTLEPEPREPAQFNVLFLGGSTTESVYVPEDHRWVAQLNIPGVINTYNAGQSGANTPDKYFSLKYLVEEKGLSFDLVVLITAANDLSWTKRLNRYGGKLVIDEYLKFLKVYKEAEIDQTLNWLDRLGGYSAIALLASIAYNNYLPDQPKKFENDENIGDIVKGYLKSLEERRRKDLRSLSSFKDCSENNGLMEAFEKYTEINLTRLSRYVEKIGARLLVMTEPSSLLAPPSSYLRELRGPLICSNGFVDIPKIQQMFDSANAALLRAAKRAGVATYDFASAIQTYSNGPKGGEYMYDAMHYTVKGSELAAQTLRPVILSMLKSGFPQPKSAVK